jgi:hypothetical protein
MTFLVWRQGAKVFHRALDAAEADAVMRLGRGTTLGLLCEARGSAHASVEDAAAEVFAWVGRWIADELLVAA